MTEELHMCPTCGANYDNAGVCSGTADELHPPEITEEVLSGEVVGGLVEAVVSAHTTSEPVAADRVSSTIPEGGKIAISFREDGKPMIGPAL